MWTATPVPSSGQLVDAAGRPVADAIVSEVSTLFSPAGEVRSDPNGRDRIGARRWPYAPIKLTGLAPGFVPGKTGGGRVVMHRWARRSGGGGCRAGAELPGAGFTVARRSQP